jgi:hypothetical protein
MHQASATPTATVQGTALYTRCKCIASIYHFVVACSPARLQLLFNPISRNSSTFKMLTVHFRSVLKALELRLI